MLQQVLLVIGGIVSGGGLVLGWLKWRSEKKTGELSSLPVLRSEIDTLLSRELEARRALRELQTAFEAASSQARTLSAENAILRAALPMMESLERLRPIADDTARVYDRLHDPFVVATNGERAELVWVNAAMCSALGLSREELLARGWRDLVVATSRQAVVRASARSIDTDGIVTVRYRRAQGGTVLIGWRYGALYRGFTVAAGRVLDLPGEVYSQEAS